MPSNGATLKKQRIFIYSLCWCLGGVLVCTPKNVEKESKMKMEKRQAACRQGMQGSAEVAVKSNTDYQRLIAQKAITSPARPPILFSPHSLLALYLYSPPRRTSSSQNSMWHLNFIVTFYTHMYVSYFFFTFFLPLFFYISIVVITFVFRVRIKRTCMCWGHKSFSQFGCKRVLNE